MENEWHVYVRFSDGEIKAVSPPGGRYQLPCIHPDGDRVVCQGGQSGEKMRIWQFDIATGERTALSPPEAYAGMPAYSWDGQRVVFSSDLAYDANFASIDETPVWITPKHDLLMALYVVDADCSNLRQITTGGHQDMRPSFHPDGQQVVYASKQGGTFKLWLTDITGENAPQLLDGSYPWAMRPWFAPDGESFFFHTEVDGAHRICRYWLATGRWEPVANDTGEVSHGSFVVPNANELLIHSKREGQIGIWRLSLTDDRAERVELPGFDIAGHATQASNGTLAFDSPERR